MAETSNIDVAARIDQAPLGPLYYKVVGLCCMIALIEGFDLQVIAFTAPLISAEWGISASALSSVFALGLVGMMVGSLTLGPAGDKFGRKAVLIFAVFISGVFCLATTLAENTTQLALYRFLTSIGLGGAIPNALAMVSEYSPARRRGAMVVAMSAGIPLGGALGGIIIAPWAEEAGWRVAYILGGIAPIVASVILLLFLPESIRFLTLRIDRARETARLLAQIDKTYTPSPNDVFQISTVNKQSRSSLTGLYADGRATGTLLLWAIFFGNLLMGYLLLSWLPSLLTQLDMGLEAAIIAASMFNIGTILSGLLLGRLLDGSSPYRPVMVVYLFGAVSALLLGAFSTSGPLLYILVFLAGVGVGGPQLAMNALASSYYPTALRGTGLGAALGVGRVGAILGPLIGGGLLAVGFSGSMIFSFVALPAIACAICVAVLGVLVGKKPPSAP